MKHPPLSLPDLDDWRSRWLLLPSGNVLHRISVIEWGVYSNGEELDYMKEEMISGRGIAVCGARGDFAMPGLISRMKVPRCAHCCDALDIPRGEGAPFNAGYQTEHLPWMDA